MKEFDSKDIASVKRAKHKITVIQAHTEYNHRKSWMKEIQSKIAKKKQKASVKVRANQRLLGQT